MATDMLREMALFVEVAKTMSFKRAADATGVPASSLSRRIAALEQAVGVRLFNRTTRSIELSEAGALYYGRCRPIVEAARVAHEQLGTLAERPSGRLRVSTTAEFAQMFLGPVISDYTSRYPDVSLEVDVNPNKVDLIAGNFDLALRIGKQPDSGLIARRLGSMRAAMFASPRYLARAGVPLQPDDLARHAVIRNLNSSRLDIWPLSDGRRMVEAPATGAVLVNNFELMRQLAIQGLGIAMLHEPLVVQDLADGVLQRVLPAWHFREASVYALMSGRLPPAKTRLFMDMLIEQVSPKLDAVTRISPRRPTPPL